MERTGADGGSSANGGARANDAHRQAHQCGFPIGGIDAAGQHHDAGAGNHGGASCAARAGAGECAAAVAASGNHDHSDRAGSICSAGCGQKAARTEILTRWSGSTCARRRRRVMLPKSVAGR